MSIFKAVSDMGNPLDILDEKAVYVLNSQKTDPRYTCGFLGENETTILTTVLKMIERNKELHGQKYGKAFHHFILRFDDSKDWEVPDANIWRAAYEVGKLFCSGDGGLFLGIMALHFDSTVAHAHYLIDNVELRSGKRRYWDRGGFRRLTQKINAILEKYEISPVACHTGDGNHHETGRESRNEL